ncbi:MATE family efflux transporter [Pseudoramibacter faecis]|uniref:MATE family efflux transporter n=1 Tax=Pseudoramibacter faecis TaxID=3108534 RepID=UPI002E76F0A6|nr:MATE family efflux transporter [Pseudoramibacter sp. HA2172]
MSNNKDFTKGNISTYLVSLAISLMAGNILQEFYNTIDAFVVGRFAGKEEFAAIGIAGTAMNLFLFALVGCCNGFSILFAQACGQKNMIELRRQHFSALVAGMGCSLFLTFIGLVCMNPLLTLLQTPEDLYGYIASYLFWIFLSFPAVFFYNLFASLLRASGDTKASLFVLIVSVIINLVLDVILVGKCQKGIEGAAIATAVTQIISAVLCFVYLWKTHHEMILQRKDCNSSHKDILKFLKTGLITSLHQSSLYLGKLLVQGTVNTGGTDVIAAYTAATRIEGFANSIGGSGSVSTSILTAQNYGAGKHERVQKTFCCSLSWLAGTGVLAALVMFIFAPQTIALMLGNNSGTSFEEGIRYLRLIAGFYLFCYTGNTFTGYYNGIGKVFVPFIGAAGHIFIRVVISWFLFPVMGLGSVALATGIGWMLVNCFWSIVYKYLKKHRKSVPL